MANDSRMMKSPFRLDRRGDFCSLYLHRDEWTKLRVGVDGKTGYGNRNVDQEIHRKQLTHAQWALFSGPLLQWSKQLDQKILCTIFSHSGRASFKCHCSLSFFVFTFHHDAIQISVSVTTVARAFGPRS